MSLGGFSRDASADGISFLVWKNWHSCALLQFPGKSHRLPFLFLSCSVSFSASLSFVRRPCPSPAFYSNSLVYCLVPLWGCPPRGEKRPRERWYVERATGPTFILFSSISHFLFLCSFPPPPAFSHILCIFLFVSNPLSLSPFPTFAVGCRCLPPVSTVVVFSFVRGFVSRRRHTPPSLSLSFSFSISPFRSRAPLLSRAPSLS